MEKISFANNGGKREGVGWQLISGKKKVFWQMTGKFAFNYRGSMH